MLQLKNIFFILLQQNCVGTVQLKFEKKITKKLFNKIMSGFPAELISIQIYGFNKIMA